MAGRFISFEGGEGSGKSTTGRSDAEELKGALMNEKASPEILQYETDLIERIEMSMDYQVRGTGRRANARWCTPAADSLAGSGGLPPFGGTPPTELLPVPPRRTSK